MADAAARPRARILIVAGEVSGDIHAGNLLESLRDIEPDLDAFGVGGDRLARAGLHCIARTEELAHMGLVEVVRELPRLRGILRSVVRAAEQRRPQVAVLVDSPDFNLRLAARLGKIGVPVVLYVSPQLWAWRRGRVRTVRRLAREVLCILPFEARFYEQNGVRARYVGHPLLDDLNRDRLLDDPPQRFERRLALLPGSRAMEVRQLLPTMLEGLAQLGGGEVAEAVLVEAPGVSHVIDEVLGAHHPDPRLRRAAGDERRRAHASCGLAWTASGTATLECALLGVPMIVGYRLRPLSAAVARRLVRVPHVALANLIAGERAAPELLQEAWNPSELVAATRSLAAGGADVQRRALREVRRRLGEPGASRRAAEAVAEYLRPADP
jgi:lipid-A-disaccharide synthase